MVVTASAAGGNEVPRQGGAPALRMRNQALACATLFGIVGLWRFSQTGAVPTKFFSSETSSPSEGATSLMQDELFNAHADARFLHDGQCTGTCTTQSEDDAEAALDSAFLMLSHKNFEDPVSPRLKESKVGNIVWYILIMFYMFAGIAVVCDEFFVPALEAFVDHFEIPMDVAGATFMAAGGSMPELSTSFIATFQESDVGFAAIVGSAVFNVLFVIAVCVVASPTALKLKGWPLARDCFFYTIALGTVAFVFGGSSKNRIEWWEALLLLFEYVGYCTFMYYNGRIREWFKNQFLKKRVSPEDETAHMRNDPSVSVAGQTFLKPSKFRKGIVQVLTQKTYLYETAGIVAVAQIKGDMKDTFQKLDKDNDGSLNTEEVKALLTLLGVKTDTDAVRTALRRIARTGEDKITYDDFKRWYLMSEARIDMEMRRVFESFDKDGNGTINIDEVMQCLQALGHAATVDEAEQVMKELLEAREANDDEDEEEIAKTTVNAKTAEITFEQFQKWYEASLFYKGKRDMVEEEAEDNDYISLDMPEWSLNDRKTWPGLAWYVYTYPLVAALYCTLPDVRNPRYTRSWKIAVVAFLLSLIWIYIFSNMLYECIVVISNTMRIPPAVAGITVLAAGTSIPDLLSSYIVAKHGEGDMAVSSSIGSNIFDVTVGLPLPWLMYNILKGKDVYVKSESLFLSILVLIFMLVCVVGTIVAMKWRMTYGLGVVMMILYWVFVTFDLLRQLPEGDPVIPLKF